MNISLGLYDLSDENERIYLVAKRMLSHRTLIISTKGGKFSLIRFKFLPAFHDSFSFSMFAILTVQICVGV